MFVHSRRNLIKSTYTQASFFHIPCTTDSMTTFENCQKKSLFYDLHKFTSEVSYHVWKSFWNGNKMWDVTLICDTRVTLILTLWRSWRKTCQILKIVCQITLIFDFSRNNQTSPPHFLWITNNDKTKMHFCTNHGQTSLKVVNPNSLISKCFLCCVALKCNSISKWL